MGRSVVWRQAHEHPGRLSNHVRRRRTIGELQQLPVLQSGFPESATDPGAARRKLLQHAESTWVIPLSPTVDPMQPLPPIKGTDAIYAYEYDFKTPYIQNFTLSANRDLSRKINLDVRYVGTKGVGLLGTININSPNVFYNPALFDALERTRRGENVELFDQIFMGLALTGTTPVNGTTQRGSEHMRQNATFQSNLATRKLCRRGELTQYV